jgi:hypothetical protein
VPPGPYLLPRTLLPNGPHRFVSHIAQGVWHHGRDDCHLPRGDAALLIPHRSLDLSLEEQENLLGAVGVGPEPVARLYGEVCSARLTRGSADIGKFLINISSGS